MSRTRAEVLTLMRSSPGRLELKRRYSNRLWPLMAYLARLYRRTLGRRVRVIAIVGSVGKTTTMRAMAAAFELRVNRQALFNANSHAAVGRALLRVRPWQRHAVLEIGIGAPGQMRIQARTVRPDVVVVTAIRRDHWQSFATLEATRDEKAEILRGLSPRGIAVLNADDPNVRWMATQTRARVVFIGEAPDAHIRAEEVVLDWPDGMHFAIKIGEERRLVRTQLMGRHMIYPALAAIAVAHLEGRSLDQAIAAVGALEPTPGRMQTMRLANGANILRDDFKSTEDAWHAALDTFAALPARRHLVVFGEISEETGNDAYREIGRRSGFVDRAIFVGSSKHMQLFRSGAASVGVPRDRVDHVRHAHEAVALLQGDLGEGDALLIRGRWQQALGRVGLALAGRDVQCRADPCPFKRMLCDVCPYLEQPFTGLPARPG